MARQRRFVEHRANLASGCRVARNGSVANIAVNFRPRLSLELHDFQRHDSFGQTRKRELGVWVREINFIR